MGGKRRYGSKPINPGTFFRLPFGVPLKGSNVYYLRLLSFTRTFGVGKVKKRVRTFSRLSKVGKFIRFFLPDWWFSGWSVYGHGANIVIRFFGDRYLGFDFAIERILRPKLVQGYKLLFRTKTITFLETLILCNLFVNFRVYFLGPVLAGKNSVSFCLI